jgi:hypothetical protein
MKLSFAEFSKANEARKKQFFKGASTDNWSISDAFMAGIGEMGEVADALIFLAAMRHLGEAGNALKKVKRAELGMLNKNAEGRQIDSLEDAKAKVAGEIGGFMCYLDQLCVQIGLRLEDCIVDEFNKKSAELNLPERIVDGRFATATKGTFYIHGDEYAGEVAFVPVDVEEVGTVSLTINPEKPEDVAAYFGLPVDNKPYGEQPFTERTMVAGEPGNRSADPELDRMKTQREEFDAAERLGIALKNLPPIVDDDYPLMRGRYESAMMDLLRAVHKNGRTLPPWR